MLIKLNKKVINVTDEDKEEKEFSPIYFSISCLGYGLILTLLDYVCYLFIGHSPLPILHYVWRLFL